MKIQQFPIFFFSLFLLSCQQQKAKQHQEAVKDMMEKYDDEKSNQPVPEAKPPSGDIQSSKLMGAWESSLLTTDDNNNSILDQEEITKGTINYKDYLSLKPDGTCKYTVARIEGTYEIVEKDGNQSIEVIAKDGSRVKYGRIIFLKPTEMHLMKFTGGRDIIVYTPVNY